MSRREWIKWWNIQRCSFSRVARPWRQEGILLVGITLEFHGNPVSEPFFCQNLVLFFILIGMCSPAIFFSLPIDLPTIIFPVKIFWRTFPSFLIKTDKIERYTVCFGRSIWRTKFWFRNFLGPFSIMGVNRFIFVLLILLLDWIWYENARGEIWAHQFSPKTQM